MKNLHPVNTSATFAAPATSAAPSGWSNGRVPLCHFFFSHPFRVGDVCHGTLPLRHPRLPAPAPLAWRRTRSRARRRVCRRYPALKAHVFLHPPGSTLVPRSPPTVEQLLGAIRDAWPPASLRSLSLDSGKREIPGAMGDSSGTDNNPSSRPLPKRGLPLRRYSVPETVMRKYTLSRTQTSSSEGGTVPTPSMPSLGSQTSAATTRRMAHKACQTSDATDLSLSSLSASDSAHRITIPTVNIIPHTVSNKNTDPTDDMNKISPNSSGLSPCEESAEYNTNTKESYRSDLSLPGAITESSMYLTIPETLLDPRDCPKESLEEEDICNDGANAYKVEITSESDLYEEVSGILMDESVKRLLEQSAVVKKRSFKRSKSKSVPEYARPPTRTTHRVGSADENKLNALVNSENVNGNVEKNELMSSVGTPTPAATCPPYDTSECYVTDCDMCSAEGRKCCSLDDSGSQSCSFTSPEMITTNELKTSSDYTTSSMTLDQTVSDRTISTQDSTLSLTSITPDSGQVKTTNISPILVIHSESILIDTVSPRNKTKDREIFHPSESSPSERTESQVADSLHLSDSFPVVISCESAVVPQNQNEQATTEQVKEMEEIIKIDEPIPSPTVTTNELNNNYEIGNNCETYLESSESHEENKNARNLQELPKNYTTNYLYLTEDEMGPNADVTSELTKSDEDFEMDTLAINETTSDESNLLEHLGFCEDLSQLHCPITDEHLDELKDEPKPTQSQGAFYGNQSFEVILKGNVNDKTLYLGNVMPVSNNNDLLLHREKVPSQEVTTEDENIDEVHLEIFENECEEIDNSILFERETTMGSVAGGTYWELPGNEQIIPRFSALPRTLSMLVNTSSVDYSSDSDLSLPDSLEGNFKDDNSSKGLKLYNKYDNRLVRGDIIALLPEESGCQKKLSHASKAYFLSLTGEEGEIKVEQIPEDLKQKLLKRENEIKKHSDHVVANVKRIKARSCAGVKKHSKHQHSCCRSNSSEMYNNSFGKCSTGTKNKLSKFTQWEDQGSSKDSSDTLVPSDFSEKDKDENAQSKCTEKEALISHYDKQGHTESFDTYHETNLNNWLEKLNTYKDNVNDTGSSQTNASTQSDVSTNFGQAVSKALQDEYITKHVNKSVQCENMPHVDSEIDNLISGILIENLKTDDELVEGVRFKCVEHQVPWSKSIEVQVSENDFSSQNKCDNNTVHDNLIKCINPQNITNTLATQVTERETTLNNVFKEDETNKIELNLTGSFETDDCNKFNIKSNSLGENENSTSFHNGRPLNKNINKITKQHEKIMFNKHTTKYTVKTTPSRRPGNLCSRFRQKFEVIPEEKSGSLDSSNDEQKPVIPTRRRRASMPSDVILADVGQNNKNRNSDSSSSSNEKTEKCEDDFYMSQVDVSDYQRRHTIHGNTLNSESSPNNTSFEKNEQSRRHTIHGSLAINSKSDSMLKQLNLLGGTLLRGRVFGKQSGVMFGRFRPVNEETQVEKDERSLVEEHLERLKRESSKGREALAVAKTEEQEELLTLSKGWINFYLLRDSQEMNVSSDDSNGEEELQDMKEQEKSRRAPPLMKTVTVVGKPEEESLQEYTIQINASPEPSSEAATLPNLSYIGLKTPKSPPQSPDVTLPDITTNSSPTTSPILPDNPNSLKPELPKIHATGVSAKISSDGKYKSNCRKAIDKTGKKEKMHNIESDKNLRYMKLSSMKQELQTEKTYFARSGEMACSELSPSSKSSSSSVGMDSPTLPSIKWPSRQLQRRSHSRHPRVTSGSAPQARWTVTLAGSSGHPTQPPPDVEMRLSFSNASRGAPTSQSDSGLGEDVPIERVKSLPPPLAQNNQWKVMLKTQQETDRSSDHTKSEKRSSLDDWTPATVRSKKGAKRRSQEEPGHPLSVQVQEILEQNISLQKSSSITTEGEWLEGLSVTGLAITPERKPRVPTMSERDLTRQWMHRSRLSH